MHIFLLLAEITFITVGILLSYIIYLYFHEQIPQILFIALSTISLFFSMGFYLIYFVVENLDDLELISKLIAFSGATAIYAIYIYKIFVDEKQYYPFEPQIVSALYGLTLAFSFTTNLDFAFVNGLLLPSKSSMFPISFSTGLLLISVAYPMVRSLYRSLYRHIKRRIFESLALFSGLVTGFLGILLVLYNPFEESVGYEIVFVFLGVLFFLVGLIRNPYLVYTIPVEKFSFLVITYTGYPIYSWMHDEHVDTAVLSGYLSLTSSLFKRSYIGQSKKRYRSLVIEHIYYLTITLGDKIVIMSVADEPIKPLVYIQEKIAKDIEREFPGNIETILKSKKQEEEVKRYIQEKIKPVKRILELP